jgi:hypothetical protein
LAVTSRLPHGRAVVAMASNRNSGGADFMRRGRCR